MMAATEQSVEIRQADETGHYVIKFVGGDKDGDYWTHDINEGVVLNDDGTDTGYRMLTLKGFGYRFAVPTEKLT